MNRAFFIVFLVLFPSLIFSQLEDVGITLQVDTPFSSRDSLDFFIIEGDSPLFERDIEGAPSISLSNNGESPSIIKKSKLSRDEKGVST